MRKILLSFACLWLACSSIAQTKVQVKSDTVKIANGELAINNSTKAVQGFLYNTGNGITSFKRGAVKLNDTTYLIGADTLHIPQFSNNLLSNSLTSGHLLVGNSSNIASDVAMSGDVSINNAGVTAIGNNKVTDGMLRQSTGLSVVGRSTNSTGNISDITGTDGQVLRVSGTTLGFGTIGNASLTNSSITIATGISGTDFNISGSPVSLGNTVTFNIPDASTTSRGLVTTGAQTFNGNKTFSGILGATGRLGTTASGNSAFGIGTTNFAFRMTNSGSNVLMHSIFDVDNSISTAGAQAFGFETANGFVFTAANGTRRIERAAIKLVNLANTAGAESGDLAFYTKPGTPSNTAATERWRIASTGELSNTGAVGTSTLTVSGSLGLSYVAKTAAYPLTATDHVVDATSGTFTITLPTAAGITGRIYVIKNSGTGTITIATTSSQTIDGSTTKTLTTQYSGCQLISDGTNWKVVASF